MSKITQSGFMKSLSPMKLVALLSLFLLLAQAGFASAGEPTRSVNPTAGETTVTRGKETRTVKNLKTVKLADGREAVADRVIVGFNKGVTEEQKVAAHSLAKSTNSRMAATALTKVGPDADLVDVSGVDSLESAIKAYANDKNVAYAEPDYIAHAMLTPNDPSFGNQWGMSKIQAPSAWNITTGSSSVKVAILDCGIYESGSSTPNGYPGHPDINGKVVARKDFTGSSTGSDDWCDHGTHVSGIVAAKTNNGVGVAGVGYNVSLMNGKVLNDSGSGSSSGITNGIYWAADNGAKVINMSLGGAGSCSSTYQSAINYAYNKNVVVVVAAGNNGNTALQQPASCNNVISVASTDSNDGKSSFSTYGSWVKVAAPGGNIYSLDYNGSYAYKSGTSMATPHVAGLAALVWSTGKYSTAAQVISRIQSTSDAISGTGSYWVYGRVNAYRAVL